MRGAGYEVDVREIEDDQQSIATYINSFDVMVTTMTSNEFTAHEACVMITSEEHGGRRSSRKQCVGFFIVSVHGFIGSDGCTGNSPLHLALRKKKIKNMETDPPTLSKLTSTNYNIWSARMKSLLKYRGIWAPVEHE
ncbi:hypothetical protein M569_13730 [Genlisea aurea]|uniref:DUF4219 domain-containing protein n=1 Tax=Genlisea aurea TaxID=192259 RepID=S8C341_9LAMI|nr:hypothetical protein M569_13730 [Genlisea aurea]